jgi:lactate dehydrogenase-like 2-hydroxyacid dehydrogenase
VLVADGALETACRDLAPRFPMLELTATPAAHDAQELASDAIDVLVSLAAPVGQPLLAALPNARLVLKLGRNYANVDVQALRKRQVRFASVPRKGPNCVAELALTLILALSKDLVTAHHSVVTGAYRLRGLHPEASSQTKHAFQWMQNVRVHEIRGKTLGIVGMGEIGYELARRATVMGMRILYHKRRRLPTDLEQAVDADYRELNSLLGESDYVCLAVPQTDETTNLIGQTELSLMRPSAFLVNVCRGGVVDEAALAEALATDRIAGAGLDVYRQEPLPVDSPLTRLNNVLLMPHLGGGTGSSYTFELGEGLSEAVRLLSDMKG